MADSLNTSSSEEFISLQWKTFDRYAGLLMADAGRVDASALDPLLNGAYVTMSEGERVRIVGTDAKKNAFLLADGRDVALAELRGGRLEIPASVNTTLTARLQASTGIAQRSITFDDWKKIKNDAQMSPEGVVINGQVYDPRAYETAPLGGESDRPFVRRVTPPAVFVGNWSRSQSFQRTLPAREIRDKIKAGASLSAEEEAKVAEVERANASAMWDNVMRQLVRGDQASTGLLNEILVETKKALEKPGLDQTKRSAPVGLGIEEEFGPRLAGEFDQAVTTDRRRADPNKRYEKDDSLEDTQLVIERVRSQARGNNKLDQIFFVSASRSEAQIARHLARLALAVGGYDPRQGPDSIKLPIKLEDLPDRGVLSAWMTPVRPSVYADAARPVIGFVASSDLDPRTAAENAAAFVAREMANPKIQWRVAHEDRVSMEALRAVLGPNADIREAYSQRSQRPADSQLIAFTDKIIVAGDGSRAAAIVAEAASYGRIGAILDTEGHVLDRFSVESEALIEQRDTMRQLKLEELQDFVGTAPGSEARLAHVHALQSVARANGASLSRKDIGLLLTSDESVPLLYAMASDKEIGGYGPEAQELYRRGFSRAAIDFLGSNEMMTAFRNAAAAEAAEANAFGMRPVYSEGRYGVERSFVGGAMAKMPENGILFADDSRLLPETDVAVRAALAAAIEQGMSPIVIEGTGSARHLGALLETMEREGRALPAGVVPTILSRHHPDRHALGATDYATGGNSEANERIAARLAERHRAAIESGVGGFVDAREAAIETLSNPILWRETMVGMPEYANAKRREGEDGTVRWQIAPVRDTNGEIEAVELARVARAQDGTTSRAVESRLVPGGELPVGSAAFIAAAYTQLRKEAIRLEGGEMLLFRQDFTITRADPFVRGETVSVKVDGFDNALVGTRERTDLGAVYTPSAKDQVENDILSDKGVARMAGFRRLAGIDAESKLDSTDKRVAAALATELSVRREEVLVAYGALARGEDGTYKLPSGRTFAVVEEGELLALKGESGTIANVPRGPLQDRAFDLAVGQVLMDEVDATLDVLQKRNGTLKISDLFSPSYETTRVAQAASVGGALAWIDKTDGGFAHDGERVVNRSATTERGDKYRIFGQREKGSVWVSIEGPNAKAAIADLKAEDQGFARYVKDTSVRIPARDETEFRNAVRTAEVIVGFMETSGAAWRHAAAFGKSLGWTPDPMGPQGDDGVNRYNRVAVSPRADVYRIVADKARNQVAFTIEGTHREAALADFLADEDTLGRTIKGDGRITLPTRDTEGFGRAVQAAQALAGLAEMNAMARAEAQIHTAYRGWEIERGDCERLRVLTLAATGDERSAHVCLSKATGERGVAVAVVASGDTVRVDEVRVDRYATVPETGKSNAGELVAAAAHAGATLAVDSILTAGSGRAVNVVGRHGTVVSLEGDPEQNSMLQRGGNELTEKAAEMSRGLYVAQMNAASALAPALAHAAQINAGRDDARKVYPVMAPPPSKAALKVEESDGVINLLYRAPETFATQVAANRLDALAIAKLGKTKLADSTGPDQARAIQTMRVAIEETAKKANEKTKETGRGSPELAA